MEIKVGQVWKSSGGRIILIGAISKDMSKILDALSATNGYAGANIIQTTYLLDNFTLDPDW